MYFFKIEMAQNKLIFYKHSIQFAYVQVNNFTKGYFSFSINDKTKHLWRYSHSNDIAVYAANLENWLNETNIKQFVIDVCVHILFYQ